MQVADSMLRGGQGRFVHTSIRGGGLGGEGRNIWPLEKCLALVSLDALHISVWFMSSRVLGSTGVSNSSMGDQQNETEPSALEVAGKPWGGSGDLVLVSLSSLWACPVASASTSLGWAPAGLSCETQGSPQRWSGPPAFFRVLPTHPVL